MSYSTQNNTNQSGQIITKQLKVDRGTDGRSWRAGKNNNGNVDVYDFKLLDDYSIGKWVNGVYIGKSVSITTDDLSKITLCVDSDVNYTYIISYNTSIAITQITKISISEMSFISTNNINISTIPLKALITPDGNNIVWLDSNNTLYKMDLDGSNLVSKSISVYSGADVKSFALSKNNVAYMYIRRTSTTRGLSVVNINDMTETFIGTNQNQLYNNVIRDTFVYNDLLYVVVGSAIEDLLLKIDIPTLGSNFETNAINLSSTYSIGADTIPKFFLTKDEDDNWYGVLYENNEADRKYCYKVDLDTRTLTPLREVTPTTDEGTFLQQVGIFSNDSATYPNILTRGATGSNGDEGGGQWMQIFGA